MRILHSPETRPRILPSLTHSGAGAAPEGEVTKLTGMGHWNLCSTSLNYFDRMSVTVGKGRQHRTHINFWGFCKILDLSDTTVLRIQKFGSG